MVGNELILNDERWCIDCGEFVMPESEIVTNQDTKEEVRFIICPECGKVFETL